MKLDRALIKAQAKQLIKNNIWKLLIISLVVSLLTGSTGIITSSFSDIGDTFDAIEDKFEHKGGRFFDKYDIFGDKIEEEEENELPGFDEFDPNHFNDFTGKINTIPTSVISDNIIKTRNVTDNLSILTLIMMPLTVTLWGVYLSLVRGRCMEIGETFTYTFSKTFDKNYFKKLGLLILSGLFTFLWSLLFIIPGIVYFYKIRFAPMIMADHPELSPMEAIRLSKRMTADHKGELFALDLSFIPWAILMVITLGIASIYAIPYISTVNALYYVNFRARCAQEGRILESEYVPASEILNQAMNNPDAQQPYQAYYQPPQSAPYQQPQNEGVQATEYTGYYQQPQSTEAESTGYYNPIPQDSSDSNDNSYGSNMDNSYWNSGNF